MSCCCYCWCCFVLGIAERKVVHELHNKGVWRNVCFFVILQNWPCFSVNVLLTIKLRDFKCKRKTIWYIMCTCYITLHNFSLVLYRLFKKLLFHTYENVTQIFSLLRKLLMGFITLLFFYAFVFKQCHWRLKPAEITVWVYSEWPKYVNCTCINENLKKKKAGE